MPVATEREVALAIQPLTFCFPQMPSSFWGFLSKQALQKGLSKQRLEYIAETLINTHHYATFTIADFFEIDKYVHELTPSEIEKPIEPMAQIQFAGKYRVVYLEEAKRCGYAYTEFESAAERDARESKEREERMQREYERRVANGEIDPNAPRKSMNLIITELADQFSTQELDMKKSERLTLYEWCEKNKDKKGAEKIFDCTAMDYVAIRTRLHNGFPYAGYEIVENYRDTKKVRIYIK